MNFYLVICAIGVVLMLTQGNTFILISYGVIMFSMFTLSTISYDEFDNGTAFLFTLPVSRKLYVAEKYVFGFAAAVIPWLVTTVFAGVYTIIKEPGTDLTEWLLTACVMLCAAFLLLAVTLPAQLKFGADKGRIALFGVVGAVVVLGVAISYILKALGIPLADILNNLSTVGLAGAVAGVTVFCILLWLISFSISLKIMEKKQF